MERDGRAGAASAEGSTAAFYGGMAVIADFADALDAARYAPVPDDWVLGLADVVTSTEALQAGRYKAVNTAGAAVISAVSNALGTLDFPFVFTGDGASFAVGPDDAGPAAAALAATVAWVGSELGLVLRGGVAGIAAIREGGADVRVARCAASDHVSYAMFSGGGRDWAERELKAGRLAATAAAAGSRPDLSGLSCRFRPLTTRNGVVLSVIAKPLRGANPPGYATALGDVLAIAAAELRAGSPVPIEGPSLDWPPQGLDMEARLQRRPHQPLLASRAAVALRSLAAAAILRRGRPFGAFSPADYRRQLVENSDFRKVDDGLMMTLDCSETAARAIEERLDAAEREGRLVHGLHRQSAALITCVVPSATDPAHVHFVDGADGGYAVAAGRLKQKSRL